VPPDDLGDVFGREEAGRRNGRRVGRDTGRLDEVLESAGVSTKSIRAPSGRTLNRRGCGGAERVLAPGQLDGLVADDDGHAALEAKKPSSSV
jgi:hypothetical protein